MNALKIVSFILVSSLAHVSAVNYCDLCKGHVACGNKGTFSDACPSDAKILKLTAANIENVVNNHNLLRNLLASGKVDGYQSASKMNMLKWDPELAYLAELNVRQCIMAHDKCRATKQYPRAGQNIYFYSSVKDFLDADAVFANAMAKWFNEYKQADQSVIDTCCGGKKLGLIGHFLQLAQDRAVAVGCAVAMYTKNNWKTMLVTCNYSFGNIRRSKVYLSGPPTSACSNRANSIFRNLCDI